MKAINGINAIVLILNIFRYFEAHQKLAIFITGVQHAINNKTPKPKTKMVNSKSLEIQMFRP